jgi:hypothetical protein
MSTDTAGNDPLSALIHSQAKRSARGSEITSVSSGTVLRGSRLSSGVPFPYLHDHGCDDQHHDAFASPSAPAPPPTMTIPVSPDSMLGITPCLVEGDGDGPAIQAFSISTLSTSGRPDHQPGRRQIYQAKYTCLYCPHDDPNPDQDPSSESKSESKSPSHAATRSIRQTTPRRTIYTDSQLRHHIQDSHFPSYRLTCRHCGWVEHSLAGYRRHVAAEHHRARVVSRAELISVHERLEPPGNCVLCGEGVSGGWEGFYGCFVGHCAAVVEVGVGVEGGGGCLD